MVNNQDSQSSSPNPQEKVENVPDIQNSPTETEDSEAKILEFKSKAIEKLKEVKLLFLGRTRKQKRPDKPSFVGRKFSGFFILFIAYSAILLYLMSTDLSYSNWYEQVLLFLVLGDPYTFGGALTLTFISLAMLFSNEKFLVWTFSVGKVHLKKFLLGIGLILINYTLVILLQYLGFDMYAFLLGAAMFWLIMQSLQIYLYSREVATRVESRWISRYSGFRYFMALLMPYLILGALVFVAWGYRYYSVILSLDYLGPIVPSDSLSVYIMQMRIIMPMLYIGLLLVFVFMISQQILTRRVSETRRAGAFDNLTYALIVITMFFYAIYNITLYMFLNQSTITAIKNVFGTGGAGNSFFLVEFGFSMFFLFWILFDIQKQFQTGIMFLSNDGLVMFLIGTILAQTTARLGLYTARSGQISALAGVLTLDRVMIPFFIMVFLGLTIVIYYLRPQETSMFLHISKATVDKEDKSLETILKFLKREYIRRGEKFLVNDVIPQLQQLTALPTSIIWSLITRINERYMDVQLLVETSPEGEKMTYLDFIPITERYGDDKTAEDRANKYMRERFTNLISQDRRKKITLSKKKLSSSKQSDLFVQALSVQYGRKIKDEEAQKIKDDEAQLVIDRAIDTDTKELVYEVMKKEYIRRILEKEDFPDFRFRISEISSAIETATRITVGRLFPLLKEMAAENWNFTLSSETSIPGHEEDKMVEFLPISDFDIYDALLEARPEKLKVINRIMQTWFERNIHAPRVKLEKLPPLTYADTEEEFQRSYFSKWSAKTMQYFANNYINRERMRTYWTQNEKLKEVVRKLTPKVKIPGPTSTPTNAPLLDKKDEKNIAKPNPDALVKPSERLESNSSSSNTSNAISSKPTVVPTPVKTTATPVPVKPTSVPTPVKSTAAPTPVKSTAAPTPVKSTATPTPEKSTATPTPEKSTATPTPVKSTTAPTPVKSTAAPTPVKSTTAPIPVKSTTAPTPVKSTAAPTPVKSTTAPTPVKSTTAPTPEKSTAAPTPEKSTAAPTPEKSVAAPTPEKPTQVTTPPSSKQVKSDSKKETSSNKNSKK